MQNDREAFDKALANVVDVNEKDGISRCTPLHLAVSRNVGMVKTLLEHPDIDVNALNNRKSTPLIEAAETPLDSAVLEMLIAKGALVDTENMHGDTALMMSVMEGPNAAVVVLLEKGADINKRTRKEETLLHLTRVVSVAKTLVAAGADYNATDDDQSTPLHVAYKKHRHGVAAFLVEAGADCSALDRCGKLAYYYAHTKWHPNRSEDSEADAAGL
ncbi:ankyrin repeat-containing domain protein [Baffinella frigidus]|nr:ankyrin repeat-containing domain protein [Cryptophyta sp. CCMP2293]